MSDMPTQPIEKLYHYTNTDALLGIIQHKSIRITDVRFLNDSSECKHFIDAAIKYLKKEAIPQSVLAGYAAKQPSYAPNAETFRNYFLDELDKIVSSYDFLGVACFSEAKNDLAQWRAYTRLGQGVCFEFDPQLLAKWAKADGFRFERCLYDEKELERQSDFLFFYLWREAFKETPKAVAEYAYDKLLDQAVLHKHPGFSAEREWRVITRVMDRWTYRANAITQFNPELQLGHLPGPRSIAPYTNFNICRPKDAADGNFIGTPGRDDTVWAFSKIWIGPASQPHESKMAILSALRANGVWVDPDNVVLSEIPYR